MKNLLKRVFMLGIMAALLLSKSAVSFAMEMDATNISSAAPENTVIEDEILIETESDFNGEITAEMKELGILSLEKIFDEEDITMYLAKIENTSGDVLEKIKVLPQVKAAEYNQLVSAYQDNNTTAAAASKKRDIFTYANFD